jgi:hypothetical protein
MNARLQAKTLPPMPQCDKARFAAANASRPAMRYSAAMASDPDDPKTGGETDFDRLARRYLDLWQGQLSGLASDQALTEQIARLFAAANAQVASVIQAAQGAAHAAQPATGTPSTAAPPGNGADDVGELRKRVAALEERLAALESRLARP